MITIYKSNSMKDCADYVIGQLQTVDRRNLNVLRTIIVPDRTSLEAERALLDAVGGSFNVQVKTFRRLANDILPKYEYLSKQAGIMALTGIIQDNRNNLVCYTKGVDNAGFVESMYDTISMMKYCKVTPNRLLNANLPRSVAGKAADIALLYQQYINYTQGRFVDSADKLDLLCQSLPQSQTVTNGYFYLYDFDNFTYQELQLIEQLMLCSCGVTVACCVAQKDSDKYLYLNDIFNGVMQVCKRNNIVPNIVDNASYCNKYVKQIGQNLFRYNKEKPIANDGFVTLHQGATRMQEVYSLACQIAEYVRSDKAHRYKDIYVVTSDITKYSDTIATIFRQFDIPYFCDNQFVLAEHPYCRFVTDYLAMYKNNCKLNYVLPVVKNYLYCGTFDDRLSQDDDVFLFENYCLKYNVSYRYDKFTLGNNEPCFNKIDAFRQKFDTLRKSVVIPNSATVQDYVALIRQLLQQTQLNTANDKFAQQQQTAGYIWESKITQQVQAKFEQVLVQAENVLGGRFVKLDDFIKLITAGFASVKISVIPVSNDCVVFANMAKARKHDIKFLALLGANYGTMPIVKPDCNLLTDANITDLNNAGVFLEPLIYTENKRERFSLFQLLCEPEAKLYVSYTATDGVNTLVPSPFVNELALLFTERGEKLQIDTVQSDKVFTSQQALSKVVGDKRKLQDNQCVNPTVFVVLEEKFGQQAQQYMYGKNGKDIRVDNGDKLYLKNSTTSVSQLTDFFHCPYKFYIEYGLNVKPRHVADLNFADLGTILHAVLEKYVAQMDKDETDSTTETKATLCFDEAMSDDLYKGLRNDSQMKGTLAQLKRESIRMCKVVKSQLLQSLFTNYKTELNFGNDVIPGVEVNFDGGKFNLNGKIDRVDVCDDKFVIIDYKSGAYAADYKEKLLYLGHKMQLLVYVKAAQDYLKKQPAGFYYFNMHDNFTDINEEQEYCYNGRTLKDIDTATKLDTMLAKTGKSTRLNIKLNKAKTDFDGHGKRVLTAEQIQNQVDYALALIAKAGELMCQGYAAINPYEEVCQYCEYKDICDFGDVLVYNQRKLSDGVTIQTIDETVQEMATKRPITDTVQANNDNNAQITADNKGETEH